MSNHCNHVKHMMPKTCITGQEAAKELGISYSVVRLWMIKGWIPTHVYYQTDISTYRAIPRHDFETWKTQEFWQIQKRRLTATTGEGRRRGEDDWKLYKKLIEEAKFATRYVS